MANIPLKQLSASGALQIVRVNAAGNAPEVAGGLTIATGGALQTTGVGNGSTSGNTRGTGAVDLQTLRTNAARVASGDYSVAAGQENTASGASSVAIGDTCTASGSNAVSIGYLSSASTTASFASGQRSNTRRNGERVHAAGMVAVSGDAQFSDVVLRLTTTDATLTEMTSPGRITLSNDSSLAFHILLVARRTDADDESAAFEFKGCIDRNTNAASTALVGVVTKTMLANDNMLTWDVTVDADTTNGALRIRCQGGTGKTVRWVARASLVEVVG